MFINLTPLIPLSLERRGGRILKRGASTLLNTPPYWFSGGRDFREGLRPSLTYTPPSLIKGRGQGDRLLNDLIDEIIYQLC